jgi:beta-glucosidase
MSKQRDIKGLIAQMTLEEKASLCTGRDVWHTQAVERLGIPSVMVTDGPHGLRKQVENADHLGLFDSVPSTCFPSAVGIASSWNRELIAQMGEALGMECQAENVGVLLGPGANIKRSPLCGRNFEYFSEDPYLSSEMATHHIKGVQSQGVGTSLKHFAANNQEFRRMSADSVVDERTLREIYLASFEGAVKNAQPWTVMCAYNKVNGEYAAQNEWLLTNVLKNEWGHEGFVVSDWGAVVDRVQSLAAGLELEMPREGDGIKQIVEAVRSGQLAEEKLDAALERLLTIVFKAVDHRKPGATYDREAHHRLAREIAAESMVLLKNENNVLPLKRGGKIAVIGELARAPRYQGSGSSQINPTKLDDIVEELTASAGAGAQVVYSQGYDLKVDDINAQLSEEALRAAKEAEIAVVFAGLPKRYESEGYDRKHMRMPANQVALIEAVAAVQPNLVVVLCNGSPIEMPWLDKAQGVLEAYLGGQALGGAVADLLFGDANPSGKLAETFPVQLSDNPTYLDYPCKGDRVEYKEGLFVGYRYYDKKQLRPLFPFGYGLSYTTFSYSNLIVDKKELADTDTLKVTVQVKNTGERAGKEIVQLYVRDVDSSVLRPLKELKGFDKVSLEPGEETAVSFELDKRSFAYYEVGEQDWIVETGQFEILIGRSSQDIALSETVTVRSTSDRKYVYDRNSTLADLMLSDKGIAFMQKLRELLPFGNVADEDSKAMLEGFRESFPLRSLAQFSGGKFGEKELAELLEHLNS